MPVSFPTMNPDTGELVPTDYYTVGEVAAMLHVSHSTVRRMILIGEWDHMTLAHVHYMSAAHIAAVVDRATVEARPAIPETTEPPKLGVPLSDTDLEGIR
jgi:hypothetical protein